jgi:hypothetical protein
MESGSWFCFGTFGSNVSVAVRYFIFNLVYFFNFYRIYKNNAAIICITVQHKKILIDVNFDGSLYDINPWDVDSAFNIASLNKTSNQ